LIIIIVFAIAALAVAAPLAIDSHASNDGNTEKDAACAGTDNTKGTIYSVFRQAASASGQDLDASYTSSVAVIEQTIDLSNLADSYPGVTWDGTNLTFDPKGNAYRYEIIQTNEAVPFEGKIIFAPGTDSYVTTDEICGTCIVTVIPSATVPVSGLDLDKYKMILEVGKNERIIATVSPSDATDKHVLWSSDNGKVASVDATGKVVGINPGTATITAKTVDGGFTATCTVTVELIIIDYDVFLDKEEITLKVGETWTLTAMVAMPDWMDKSVKWSSSDKSVATVDKNGLVTAVGVGTTAITVTTNEGGFTASCNVIVAPLSVPVTGVTLDQYSMTLNIWETSDLTLTATVCPLNATDKHVLWSSDNGKVASVDATGKVVGINQGTATITAKTVDGGFTATCVVTVVYITCGVDFDLQIDKKEMTLEVG
jgi:uncharacterized protein YjdB